MIDCIFVLIIDSFMGVIFKESEVDGRCECSLDLVSRASQSLTEMPWERACCCLRCLISFGLMQASSLALSEITSK